MIGRLSLSLLAVTLLGAAAFPAAAEEITRCVIEVEATAYLDGPCNFESEADGSFTLGTGAPDIASEHFAYIYVEGDTATGFWNGTPPGDHAHAPLGDLRRDGPCWISDTARICAYR